MSVELGDTPGPGLAVGFVLPVAPGPGVAVDDAPGPDPLPGPEPVPDPPLPLDPAPLLLGAAKPWAVPAPQPASPAQSESIAKAPASRVAIVMLYLPSPFARFLGDRTCAR
jgi:hypothetical protein